MRALRSKCLNILAIRECANTDFQIIVLNCHTDTWHLRTPQFEPAIEFSAWDILRIRTHAEDTVPGVCELRGNVSGCICFQFYYYKIMCLWIYAQNEFTAAFYDVLFYSNYAVKHKNHFVSMRKIIECNIFRSKLNTHAHTRAHSPAPIQPHDDTRHGNAFVRVHESIKWN